ncbi:unnamed protein product, partial [Pylaiella littoralis]
MFTRNFVSYSRSIAVNTDLVARLTTFTGFFDRLPCQCVAWVVWVLGDSFSNRPSVVQNSLHRPTALDESNTLRCSAARTTRYPSPLYQVCSKVIVFGFSRAKRVCSRFQRSMSNAQFCILERRHVIRVDGSHDSKQNSF